MSNYQKSTNFTSKDTLPPGDPLKIVKGAEFDIEFNALQVAVNTKADSNSPTLTGTPLAPTAPVGTNTSQIATTGFVQAAAPPIGEIIMWPTFTPPTGYLICGGQAVSRVTYAALFAVVGITFGAGDGSTTFNVPNFVDRMPIGVGNLYGLSQAGGSADAQVIAHSHSASVSDPGHQHQIAGTSTASLGAYDGPGGNMGNYTTGTTTANQTGISVTVNSAGVSGTGANLPPYRAINFAIRAGL